MKTRTTHPKEKKTETVQDQLSNFGKKLKDWNGDLNEIGSAFKTVLKSSDSAFKETKDPCYLLLSFVLQTTVSYILSKSVMSKMFFKAEKEYEFPKETVGQLGDKILDLSRNVNQPTFLPKLLSVLAFAYQNDLLPRISTS